MPPMVAKMYTEVRAPPPNPPSLPPELSSLQSRASELLASRAAEGAMPPPHPTATYPPLVNALLAAGGGAPPPRPPLVDAVRGAADAPAPARPARVAAAVEERNAALPAVPKTSWEQEAELLRGMSEAAPKGVVEAPQFAELRAVLDEIDPFLVRVAA